MTMIWTRVGGLSLHASAACAMLVLASCSVQEGQPIGPEAHPDALKRSPCACVLVPQAPLDDGAVDDILDAIQRHLGRGVAHPGAGPDVAGDAPRRTAA